MQIILLQEYRVKVKIAELHAFGEHAVFDTADIGSKKVTLLGELAEPKDGLQQGGRPLFVQHMAGFVEFVNDQNVQRFQLFRVLNSALRRKDQYIPLGQRLIRCGDDLVGCTKFHLQSAPSLIRQSDGWDNNRDVFRLFYGNERVNDEALTETGRSTYGDALAVQEFAQ